MIHNRINTSSHPYHLKCILPPLTTHKCVLGILSVSGALSKSLSSSWSHVICVQGRHPSTTSIHSPGDLQPELSAWVFIPILPSCLRVSPQPTGLSERHQGQTDWQRPGQHTLLSSGEHRGLLPQWPASPEHPEGYCTPVSSHRCKSPFQGGDGSGQHTQSTRYTEHGEPRIKLMSNCSRRLCTSRGELCL